MAISAIHRRRIYVSAWAGSTERDHPYLSALPINPIPTLTWTAIFSVTSLFITYELWTAM